MQIVDANIEDIDEVVEFARMFHATTPSYCEYDFDDALCASRAAATIALPEGIALLALDGYTIVGLMFGLVTEMVASRAKVATDLGLMVHPDSRGRAGVMLIREFERQARARGANEIRPGISTGDPRVVRLYERLGFESFGALMRKVL